MTRQTTKTYCYGPTVMLTKPITWNDFLEICLKIQDGLASALGERYIVAPEKVCEGGIQFIDPSIPDTINDERAYKSMRIRADRCFYRREYTNDTYQYPPIDSVDPLGKFRDSDQIFIGPCREAANRKFISGFETVLKAFGKNSKPWSDAELSLIESVFTEYGCRFVKKIKLNKSVKTRRW